MLDSGGKLVPDRNDDGCCVHVEVADVDDYNADDCESYIIARATVMMMIMAVMLLIGVMIFMSMMPC